MTATPRSTIDYDFFEDFEGESWKLDLPGSGR